MPAFLANIVNPISAFVMAIFMAFYNLFGGWFGFIEETPETPDVGSPEAVVVYETTDPEEILPIYNAALEKTSYGSVNGHQTMTLDGEITGDGAIGTIVEVISPAINEALENNSTSIDYIPGSYTNELQINDIAECHMSEYDDGTVAVSIYLKEQVDGANADNSDGGPVTRGIGTVGNIDNALWELGAEITSGADTISLTYREALIDCTIDPDGYIVFGVYRYYVDVHIGSAKAKLGSFTMNLNNLDATVEYCAIIDE